MRLVFAALFHAGVLCLLRTHASGLKSDTHKALVAANNKTDSRFRESLFTPLAR